MRQCRLVLGGEKVVVTTSIFFENPRRWLLEIENDEKKESKFLFENEW